MRIRLTRHEASALLEVLQSWIEGFEDSAFEAEEEILVDLLTARDRAQRIYDKIRRRL